MIRPPIHVALSWKSLDIQIIKKSRLNRTYHWRNDCQCAKRPLSLVGPTQNRHSDPNRKTKWRLRIEKVLGLQALLCDLPTSCTHSGYDHHSDQEKKYHSTSLRSWPYIHSAVVAINFETNINSNTTTNFFKTWKKCLPEDGDAEERSLNFILFKLFEPRFS